MFLIEWSVKTFHSFKGLPLFIKRKVENEHDKNFLKMNLMTLELIWKVSSQPFNEIIIQVQLLTATLIFNKFGY